jgi:hypothetical protein
MPNPFRDMLEVTIEVPEDAEKVEMILYDGLGQLVLKREFDRSSGSLIKYVIDGDQLSSSLYILHVRSGDRIATKLLINSR